MKAVVLAAGEGRRLRPLTRDMGKGMLPVANRPILEHVLMALKAVDVTDIVMVVGYKKEKVMNHFGDGGDLGMNIEYRNQKFQLGTANALQQAEDAIDGPFLMVPGDSMVTEQGLRSLMSLKEGQWGMMVTQSSNSSKYGLVEVSGDRLRTIHEKPKLTEDLISTGTPSIFALALWEYQDPVGPSLINTGTYLLDKEIFKEMAREEGKVPVLTSVLTRCARTRDVRVKSTDRWLDAVYPFDLLTLNEGSLGEVANSSGGRVEEGVVIKGPAEIKSGAIIRANTVIRGPVVIGEGSVIGPGSYIGANTSIGENCSVGPFTHIKNSLIMDDAKIGSHSSIVNTVISFGSSVSDFLGVERGEYSVKLERYSFSKVLGAVIGPDCELSHHVSLGPGVILGSSCRIGPMNSVIENLPDGARVI